MSKIVDQFVNHVLESDEYLRELFEKLIAENIPKHEIQRILRETPGIVGKKRSRVD